MKLSECSDQLNPSTDRRLREPFGVVPQTTAALLSTDGDNPERFRNEASLAALCEVNPFSTSSGKTLRHSLNRGMRYGRLQWSGCGKIHKP
ncbi:TPA: transposase, partial [Aeromonas dhakensis]|nr:transposase [Aeromonas dhakensis]